MVIAVTMVKKFDNKLTETGVAIYVHETLNATVNPEASVTGH